MNDLGDLHKDFALILRAMDGLRMVLRGKDLVRFASLR